MPLSDNSRRDIDTLVARALELLNRAGLLTGESSQANRAIVVEHQYPPSIVNALEALNRAGLLTGEGAQANFNAVAGHQYPSFVAEALDALNRAGLLTGEDAQANRDIVARRQYPSSVARALGVLNHAGLLTGEGAQANRDIVAIHRDPYDAANALTALNHTGLLTGEGAQANRDAVAGHQAPAFVSITLAILNPAGLLTGEGAQANFNAVAGNQYQASVVGALAALNRAGLLTGEGAQANFNAVVITYSDILLHRDTGHLWARMPHAWLTRARFDAIIAICHQHTENVAAGRAPFIAHLNREIPGINGEEIPGTAQGPRINESQSTHTASIHQSASESATRLMGIYGAQISGAGLDRTLAELSSWLTAQPDSSEKIMAAKRCLQRLTAPDYSFTDRASHVSTKQLLALFWIAIHDEERRSGSLDGAISQLVEGLYEIQREYNLSERGVDNGVIGDLPACTAGTFNKILEKGANIHSGIAMVFISLVGFRLKFPCAVNEAAMAYLRGLPIAERVPLIEAIKAEGNENSVGPIWEAIQATVTANLFGEFGSLFQNGRTTPAFVDAIATGEYVRLNTDNVSALDQLIPKLSTDAGTVAATGEAAMQTTAHPDGFFTSPGTAPREKSVAMTGTTAPSISKA